MGVVADQFQEAFRDYNTDGVPASGAYDPAKAQLRQLGVAIDGALVAASQGFPSYLTVADLPTDDDLPAEGSQARVSSDPTSTNNGVWIVKSGEWVFDEDYYNAIATTVQPLVDNAEASEDLARHYANDDTDTDVPGGSPGERGARFLSNDAKATIVAAGIDTSSTRYVWDKETKHARTSVSFGLGDAITIDGYHYAKYTIRGLNGLSFAQNPIDGFWEIGASGLTFGIVNFTSGGAIEADTTRYYNDWKVIGAIVDGKRAGGVIVDERGITTIPKLASPAISTAALETANYLFETVTLASGNRTIVRKAKADGTVATITPAACNSFGPRLSFDGSKVLYTTDRDGRIATYYQLLAGTRLGTAVEHLAKPSSLILGLGDSIMATGWINGVVAQFETALVSPASVQNAAGGPTAGGGIGSQNSIQIVARYGACGYAGLAALTCSVTGNQIVAGTNQLTAISVPLISRAADALNPGGDGVGATRTLLAWLGGVHGVLTSVQKPTADGTTVPPVAGFNTDNYTYTFTPDAGATLPVAVAAGSVLEIDPEARQDVILVMHIGRNDVPTAATVGDGWDAKVKLAVAAVYAAYKPLIREICIMGVTNARQSDGSEDAGTPVYNAIVALNSDLAALYPANFLDIRAVYSSGVNDVPSVADSDDGVHPNASGQAKFTAAVTAFITAKGWFA